ncbi:D-glycero-beta-D-manno-heptose 1,7-bisphosphate 7-phosphatase [Candidatus Thioglobus sp.]|nr:D-glycero-beta-D-manno-heptose 1,7-bisphosphate 7-phosphatase [Candidatus Thioglobus sp.]
MSIKTIFLDRDGVINKEKEYLYKINDFEFIDGIFEACHHFIKLDYKIIIITNQSGISRRYFTDDDFQIITKWMLQQFENNNIRILDVLYCPHSPSSNCDCRKPKPGMLNAAKNKYSVSMENSWMIGDSERDIRAANLAGIEKTILVRSGHQINEEKSSAMLILDSINQVNQFILK